MKLQFDAQQLRVRIDEDELAALLRGQPVDAATQAGETFALRLALQLHPFDEAHLEGPAARCQLHLPEAPVRELAGRLPTREGLRFAIAGTSAAGTLAVLFDVDVRDSARRLKASRKA
ncbi:hypothetical protein [Dyella sp.]|jgi:hypothetical protein|uniref:hypothetical protein n=1 Tax=Dyella sp. TaxID=1869338 RepID=UPI002D778BB6|nr:hypothetical protein [Dyella sp.]HET6432839.1 hypothetical protein [Dyella sp.]